MNNMLFLVITVLIALWVLGQVMSFGGPIIHFLLVVAVIIFLYNLLTRGRASL